MDALADPATPLKEVYQAATLEEAERQLTRFEEAWADVREYVKMLVETWAIPAPLGLPAISALRTGSLRRARSASIMANSCADSSS